MDYLRLSATISAVIIIILTAISFDSLQKKNVALKDENAQLIIQLEQHKKEGKTVETKVVAAQEKAKVIVQTKIKEIEVIKTQPIPTDCSATIWAIEHKGDLAW